jgi:uncharacterized protein YndB with AHSA1/START domain
MARDLHMTTRKTNDGAFNLSLALSLMCFSAAVQAETSQVSSSGFTVTHATVVAAEPEQVWAAFTQLPRWWKSSHSWSGQASNMSLDAEAGGCWCERWGNGNSAVHGRVLMAQPGSVLRLQAWLGPLQDLPVAGVLTFGTAKRDGETRLRVVYRVAGGVEAGLDTLAGPVDSVIGEQVRRLKAFIETGKAD